MKSIKTKIVALLLCCVVLSTASIGAMSLWKMTDILYASAERHLQFACQKSADEIDDLMEATESIAAGLARQTENLLENHDVLQDKARRDRYIETIAKEHLEDARGASGVLGVYVHLYPEDETKAEYSWQRTGAADNFCTVSQEELAMETEKGEAFSYIEDTCQMGVASWTGRYQSERLGIRLISYAMPLFRNDRFFGVLGVEIAWDMIEAEIQKIKAYDSGKAFLFSESGRILYTPIAEDSETLSSEILSGLTMYKQKGNDVLSYVKNGQKGKLVFSELRNGMYLCVSVPDAAIYKPQNELLRGTVQVFLLILACSLLIALLLANRLTKPLKKLKYATRKMSQGDFDVDLVPETDDEVGQLTETFIEVREELKKQMEELETKAFHDELTGVNNKSALAETEAQINKRIKKGNIVFSVAMLDVNMLKVTNDALGHAAGDVLLKTVAHALIADFGQDNVFRVGGDEFLIYSEGETAIYNALEACLDKLEDISAKENGRNSITCAFGTASYDKNKDKSFADVMVRADKAMYKNKGEFQRRSALWRTGSAGLRKIHIEKYSEFLKILSQSTEDYLFLLEIQTKTNWFFGNIYEKYNLCKDTNATTSLKDILAITHPKDRAALSEDIRAIANGESLEYNMEYRWINKDGETVWVNCRGRVIQDEDGKPFVMIGRASDSSMRLYYNPLTGLFNKEKFRRDVREGALINYNVMMLLHVDGMGEFNLKKGRAYGDGMLRELASVLEDRFSLPAVYHMEQDRFAVLLSVSAEQEIKDIFSDIQTAIPGGFTVSAAVVPNDKGMYVDEDNIYEVAKQILKENRGKEKSQLLFFSKEDLLKKKSSAELLEELERSVENDCAGFYLCFQPQVNADSLAVIGAEALLRYQSEKKEPIYPDVFIPLLERTGLINDVGMWVLDEALKMCKKWRETLPAFRVSVNFSVVQLRQEDLLEKILRSLAANGLRGDALTMEITESVQLDEAETLAHLFDGLDRAGVRISIDDFGTGYANLGYLRKIHANEIKIDRMFIRDVEKNAYNYEVINNTIGFAHANGIEACLEGVEKTEELAVIENLHADVLQGYLFAKPISGETFEEEYIRSDSEAYRAKKIQTEELHKMRTNMHIVRVNTKKILEETKIGLWVIRVKDGEGRGELFADATMQELLGMDASLSPQESYLHWYNKIEPGQLAAVHTMLRKMIESQKVLQVEYSWLHPTKGKVLVRCTGKCVKKEDGITMFEGFHRIVSDVPEIRG